jgi:hypothetical protein
LRQSQPSPRRDPWRIDSSPNSTNWRNFETGLSEEAFAVFLLRSHERLARLGGMGKVAGFPDAARR